MRSRPNILLVTVDSLRADRLGCYGYQRATSPHLDHFAAEAILFRNAFANGPNTPHAFPAIMAARSALASSQFGLFDVPATLSECLKDAGYHTVAFNAANPYVSKSFDYHRGFDDFADYLDFEIDKKKFTAQPTGQAIALPGLDMHHYLVSEETIQQKAQLEQQINQDIIAKFDELAATPFFLWVHYMDTHYPYVPQAGAQISVNGSVIAREENLHLNQRVRENSDVSPATLAKLKLLYDGAVRQVDGQVGALFQALKARGIYDDSLILFTADHGEEFHEHGDLQHKSKLFDELLHVPLLLKLPGQHHGEKKSELVSHLQVAPTILSTVGIEHAFSHGNFLTDKSSKMIFAAASYGQENGTPVDRDMFRIDRMPKRYCVRTPQWKFISDAGGARLLSLIDDPDEQQNRADENPNKLRQLSLVASSLRTYHERTSLDRRIAGLRDRLEQTKSKRSCTG